MPWTWFYIQVSEETVRLNIQLDCYKDTITGCFCSKTSFSKTSFSKTLKLKVVSSIKKDVQFVFVSSLAIEFAIEFVIEFSLPE